MAWAKKYLKMSQTYQWEIPIQNLKVSDIYGSENFNPIE